MNIRSFGTATFLSLLPSLALASPPSDGEGGGGVSLGASASADSDTGASAGTEADASAAGESGGAASDPEFTTMDRKEVPWIKRWAPEPHMVEFGVALGGIFIGENHELFGPSFDLPDQGYKPFKPVSGEFALRLGYFPMRFFGVEAEGALMPSPIDGGGEALVYSARGHLVGQLGFWSVTPFVVLGAGALGVSSNRAALGKDVDPALHFGGGLKFYINRHASVRLDIRDVVTYKQSIDSVFVGHNPEFLVGLSITLNRKKHEGPYDKDGDGFTDDVDSCPDEAETVNDYQDEDGCPEQDPDNDRFFDDQDQCPTEPESDNGYKDEDGCPDEVPKEVAAFTGTIQGITFETDSDKIRKSSNKTLDSAVEVLIANPEVRIKISGHTDNQGDHDHNLDLSRRRAESVKAYFVGKGVDEKRIEVEGLGPDKPVDTNDTKKGRSNNRRIEFEILRRAR